MHALCPTVSFSLAAVGGAKLRHHALLRNLPVAARSYPRLRDAYNQNPLLEHEHAHESTSSAHLGYRGDLLETMQCLVVTNRLGMSMTRHRVCIMLDKGCKMDSAGSRPVTTILSHSFRSDVPVLVSID
jgi:hypothetical protein